MIPPQIVSISLNEEPGARHKVQLYRDEQIPDGRKDMPDEIKGKFLELKDSDALFFEAATERQMILNQTQTRYSFDFSPTKLEFTATKMR